MTEGGSLVYQTLIYERHYREENRQGQAFEAVAKTADIVSRFDPALL